MRNQTKCITGNTMVASLPGRGKAALQSQFMPLFLARSDVSQIRDAYTDADRERLAAAILGNTNIWYSLNPGDEQHDR